MENLKSVVGDAKISPNCLMPKFKRPKVASVRCFPESFTQKTEEDIDELEIESIKTDVTVGEKLVYGENNGIYCGDQAMEVEPVVVRKADSTLGYEMPGDLKDGEQGTVDECGSTEHIDMMKVVDTLKRNVQVDNGACLDLVYELKTRERDRTKPKRRKVSSLRDFPKDLKSYEVVDQKYQADCVGESGDVPVDDKSKEHCVKETNDESDEHLKVDFMSQGDLVYPMVEAFSCGEEFEKQGTVVTVELEGALQSDVDLELHDEVLKDEETVGEFESGQHDNNSFSMVENVPIVETASEDAENPHLLSELCTSLVYPCRFPKRRKVSAARDFPDALKILKARNEASEKNLDHRAADELAGKNETTCDSQDDVEHIETETQSRESSAPTEKGLSCNLMTSLTPTKEDSVNFGANTVYKLTSVGHDGAGADKQEPASCGANSTSVNTQSTSEVTNSNKRIGGKEEQVKCIKKTIVEDSIATPRCHSMPSKRYRSDTKTNQNKGKGKGKDEVLKRKQNEVSAPITVVLALMAPTKCPH